MFYLAKHVHLPLKIFVETRGTLCIRGGEGAVARQIERTPT